MNTNIRENIQKVCSEDKKYLEIDAICTKCGAIINSYYENSCVLCSCGSKEFVSGQIAIDIRTLLEIQLIELKIICVIHDISLGSRAKMIYGIVKKLHGVDSDSGTYIKKKINENLIRKVIIRKRPTYWYVKEIEKLMSRK